MDKSDEQEPLTKAQPQQDSFRRIRFPRQREARMEAETVVLVVHKDGKLKFNEPIN